MGLEESPARDKRSKTRLVIAVILLTFFPLVLFEMIAWEPVSKYVHRQVKRLRKFFRKVPILDVRGCFCDSDEEIVFDRDDGVRISGSLFGETGTDKQPDIILLHGNTPKGRKLAFYKVLAEMISKKGYLVLSIDLTWFGGSDDPFLGDTAG